jgi:hypothetical protein
MMPPILPILLVGLLLTGCAFVQKQIARSTADPVDPKTTQQIQRLEDKLLIEQVRTLNRQLPILEVLAEVNPDKKPQKQLESVRKTLKEKQKELSKCGWRPDQDQDLAKECLNLSLALEDDPLDKQKLHLMVEKERKKEQEIKDKKQAVKVAEWRKRNQNRLQLAKKQFRNNRLHRARTLLNQILKDDPGNQAAKALLQQLEANLEQYLSNLLKAGDRLYREGEIEAARLTWKAAQNLSPDDVRVKEKLERAEKVLENLNNLREQQ